jgi:hypothetical protein
MRSEYEFKEVMAVMVVSVFEEKKGNLSVVLMGEMEVVVVV